MQTGAKVERELHTRYSPVRFRPAPLCWTTTHTLCARKPVQLFVQLARQAEQVCAAQGEETGRGARRLVQRLEHFPLIQRAIS